MILINYGTNEYFEESKGDKYYCKNIKNAKAKLKELLEIDGINTKSQEEIFYKLESAETYIFLNANIEMPIIDLYIKIQEINLL